MLPTLLALAGRSRSGKGTCAAVFQEEAAARGLTYRERQLSGAGKRHLAQIFRPGISEEDAIAFFESLKGTDATISLESGTFMSDDIPLPQFLQRGIQDLRDAYGDGFWTDKLLPIFNEYRDPVRDLWHKNFKVDGEVADICVVPDLRQTNEAIRVRSCKGLVIEVVRPSLETDHDAYVTGRDHITEQTLDRDLVDITIINDADTEEGFRDIARNTINDLLTIKTRIS